MILLIRTSFAFSPITIYAPKVKCDVNNSKMDLLFFFHCSSRMFQLLSSILSSYDEDNIFFENVRLHSVHPGSYLGAEILNGNLLLTNTSLLSIEKVMKINVSVKKQSILCRRANGSQYEYVHLCSFIHNVKAK